MLSFFFDLLTDLWSNIAGFVSAIADAFTTLWSFPALLPSFASLLPSPIMTVVCSMFLVTIFIVCLKAILQKV